MSAILRGYYTAGSSPTFTLVFAFIFSSYPGYYYRPSTTEAKFWRKIDHEAGKIFSNPEGWRCCGPLSVAVSERQKWRDNESRDDRMCLANPNLFIVSGGPGSGKSTVLRELAGRGFSFAPEVARQIIQEQIQAGGTALPWGDREAYARLMLQRSIESYLEYTPALKPMFSDRGIPDTLCYARLIGLRGDGFIRDACRRYRYAPLVFLAPPWKEIYETDNERRQDFAEAGRTFDQMAEVYRQCGYALSELPKATPAARAAFILRQLHLD